MDPSGDIRRVSFAKWQDLVVAGKWRHKGRCDRTGRLGKEGPIQISFEPDQSRKGTYCRSWNQPHFGAHCGSFPMGSGSSGTGVSMMVEHLQGAYFGEHFGIYRRHWLAWTVCYLVLPFNTLFYVTVHHKYPTHSSSRASLEDRCSVFYNSNPRNIYIVLLFRERL